MYQDEELTQHELAQMIKRAPYGNPVRCAFSPAGVWLKKDAPAWSHELLKLIRKEEADRKSFISHT